MSSDHTITQLLDSRRAGTPGAGEELYRMVYEELRAIARRQQIVRRGGTLDTTAIVHEAFLKLEAGARNDCKSRAHFFGVAATAMRHIIIDYAREQGAAKRGGGQRGYTLEEERIAAEESEHLLAIDEALARLAELDARMAQVVECRFFAGLTEVETAEALSVSRRTVQRDWIRARAWLRTELDN